MIDVGFVLQSDREDCLWWNRARRSRRDASATKERRGGIGWIAASRQKEPVGSPAVRNLGRLLFFRDA